MLEHRTTRCQESGHAEFRFTFGQPLPVPNLEHLLLNYFESAVAQGTQFEPDQIVQMGCVILKLVQDGEGFLLLRALGDDADWHDDIGPALMGLWRQQEVARSVDLTPDFIHPATSALVCTRATELLDVYFMQRTEREQASDSGWSIVCGDEDHDHNDPDSFIVLPLMSVVAMHPFLQEFLALPEGTEVVVEVVEDANGALRVSADIYVDEGLVEPGEDSYLGARNQLAREA